MPDQHQMCWPTSESPAASHSSSAECQAQPMAAIQPHPETHPPAPTPPPPQAHHSLLHATVHICTLPWGTTADGCVASPLVSPFCLPQPCDGSAPIRRQLSLEDRNGGAEDDEAEDSIYYYFWTGAHLQDMDLGTTSTMTVTFTCKLVKDKVRQGRWVKGLRAGGGGGAFEPPCPLLLWGGGEGAPVTEPL